MGQWLLLCLLSDYCFVLFGLSSHRIDVKEFSLLSRGEEKTSVEIVIHRFFYLEEEKWLKLQMKALKCLPWTNFIFAHNSENF